MSDEARFQYAKNHPIRELFDRLQADTSSFENTHPPLDTRFLSVFQNRLSERFLEMELQMQLSVKLVYYRFGRKPKKLDILTTQETVMVKSLQASISDEQDDSSEYQEDYVKQSVKCSTDDLFDIVAVGFRTERLKDKHEDLRRLAMSDINDSNTASAVYHLLAEYMSGNLLILIFALATKKDAFAYIKGGKHTYLNHEVAALRCSTQKLVLTFLLASEGSDSAIWSDELEYMELLSSNGLHCQTLFGRKSSYQHVIFAFGEFPVTSGLLNLIERERCTAGILTDSENVTFSQSISRDEHANLMVEREESLAKEREEANGQTRQTDRQAKRQSEPVELLNREEAIGFKAKRQSDGVDEAASETRISADKVSNATSRSDDGSEFPEEFFTSITADCRRAQEDYLAFPDAQETQETSAFHYPYTHDTNESNIYAKSMEELVVMIVAINVIIGFTAAGSQ